MGVKGITSFIYKSITKFSETIDLCAEAQKYPDKDAYLFLDGSSLTYYLYRASKLDWIQGGQYFQFELFVNNYLDGFLKNGFKLIAFFDGLVEEIRFRKLLQNKLG